MEWNGNEQPVQHAPATPARNADPGYGAAQILKRTSLRHHLWRAGLVAAAVVFVGAGVSVTLAAVGIRDCSFEGGVEVCREVHFYPLTIQRRSDVTTRNGALDGLRREWHRGGAPWIEGTYQRGEKVGQWREWHPNGALRFEGTYSDGRLSGVESWFFDDGTPEWRAQRIHGRRQGVELWWWPNGNLRRTGSYVNGDKHGDFAVFNPDGTTAFNVHYEHGARAAGGADDDA